MTKSHPSPISDCLRQTIAKAIKSGETNYKRLEVHTGVSRGSIMRFVEGKRTLRLNIADKLADHFGLELQRKKKGR